MIESFRVNAVGAMHAINSFMPLILKGKQKKVIAISSGLGDIEATRTHDLDWDAPYSVSKTALNGIIAKFSAEYRKEGVLVLSLCPGMVDSGSVDLSTSIHT